MKRMITSIIVVFFFLAGPVAAEESRTVTLKIEGMTCGACAAKVKQQLSSLCQSVTIDLEKGEGICQHEASVTPDQILREANKTGFKTYKLN